MADGEFRNNKLTRALTWNPDNVLTGARHVTLAGDYAYVTTDAGLVVLDLSTPLEPKVTAQLPLTDARASAVQFRYLWVTDAEGVKLFDITHMDRPEPVPGGNGAARQRAQNLSRAHLHVRRGQAGRSGDRRRDAADGAGRLARDDLWGGRSTMQRM